MGSELYRYVFVMYGNSKSEQSLLPQSIQCLHIEYFLDRNQVLTRLNPNTQAAIRAGLSVCIWHGLHDSTFYFVMVTNQTLVTVYEKAIYFYCETINFPCLVLWWPYRIGHFMMNKRPLCD